MSIISKKNNYIFFANPRTGSTMINSLLTKKYDGIIFPKTKNKKIEIKHITHKDLIEKHYISKSNLKKYYKITNIRNPYDKAISSWLGLREWAQDTPHWLKGKQIKTSKLALYSKNFDEYLKLNLFYFLPFSTNKFIIKFIPEFVFIILIKIAYQFKLTPGHKEEKKYLLNMDYIIRFEKIEEDFTLILKKLNLIKKNNKRIKLPVINKTKIKNKHYSLYYSSFSKKFIGIAYKNIIEKYKYKYEVK